MHVGSWWTDTKRGNAVYRIQICIKNFTKRSYQNLFANAKTNFRSYNTFDILPAYHLHHCFSMSPIVPKIIYLLANKEEMVYVRFKTPENTPPEARLVCIFWTAKIKVIQNVYF